MTRLPAALLLLLLAPALPSSAFHNPPEPLLVEARVGNSVAGSGWMAARIQVNAWSHLWSEWFGVYTDDDREGYGLAILYATGAPLAWFADEEWWAADTVFLETGGPFVDPLTVTHITDPDDAGLFGRAVGFTLYPGEYVVVLWGATDGISRPGFLLRLYADSGTQLLSMVSATGGTYIQGEREFSALANGGFRFGGVGPGAWMMVGAETTATVGGQYVVGVFHVTGEIRSECPMHVDGPTTESASKRCAIAYYGSSGEYRFRLDSYVSGGFQTGHVTAHGAGFTLPP